MAGKRYRPVSGRLPSRPVSRSFWRLLRGGLGCGILLFVSISLSKAAMCDICSHYLTYIRPASFWILNGTITLLLLLVNLLLVKLVRDIFFSSRTARVPRDTLVYNPEPRSTRSGATYGYL